MKLGRVRVRRIAPGEDAAAWSAALGDPAWLEGAEVFKDEPGSGWVRRARMNGREVVVKGRLLNRGSRRFKASLGLGHAAKQWRGAARLARAGLATARPLVHAEAHTTDGPVEVLVLEFIEGTTVLHLLAEARAGGGPTVREQHRLAAAVGATVPALLNVRLWNRDHKPSNLIVQHVGAGPARIAIVDSVAIGRYPWLGAVDEGQGEEMLAALVIEAIGCGCPPRRALWMRALHAALDPACRAERAFRHAAIREVLSGLVLPDPASARPRVDPLARERSGATA